MWKKYSIKTQIILILLIPIMGLVVMTITNVNNALNEYRSINQSIENINNIAYLSEGVFLISRERGDNNYVDYDKSKINLLAERQEKTNDWFLRAKLNSPELQSNIKVLNNSIVELRKLTHENLLNPEDIYVKYSDYSQALEMCISNEVINCSNAKLSMLANNYNNYILLKRTVFLKRGAVFRKLINVEKHKLSRNSLSDLFIKGGYYEERLRFNLKNIKKDTLVNDLISFVNSDELNAYNKKAIAIFRDLEIVSPLEWWTDTSDIIVKVNNLENNKLKYILDYAHNLKEEAFRSIVLMFVFLTFFSLLTVLLFYKLIYNLSTSLTKIASTIKKISEGKIIGDPKFSGNSNFTTINTYFNQLLDGTREQFNLAKSISAGSYGQSIPLRSSNDTLNKAMNTMSLELKKMKTESELSLKFQNYTLDINKSILKSKDLLSLGRNICSKLVLKTMSCQATFYYVNEGRLQKIGGYAEDANSPEFIEIGEGMLGEVAATNKQMCYNNLPNHYSYVSSSLGFSPFYNVLITPITYKKEVVAVIEIGSLKPFDDFYMDFLNRISDLIGNTLEVLKSKDKLQLSMLELNNKNNELQVQEEELRQSNNELNKHAQLLQQSEEELRIQASELEQTNSFIEEKNKQVEIKNAELLVAQEELEIKAKEIEQSSKYKSEFLANMSHELRTPLNSILILSDILKENNLGNLNPTQIDNLSVINSSGKDLLNLITDILDISKIESGKVEVYQEETVIERVYSDMDGLFRAQMQKKNIDFVISIAADCPTKLNTDIGKLEQILKNFLSNALKFTPANGSVQLRFSACTATSQLEDDSLLKKMNPTEILQIQIEDNGIGISEENKAKLFTSFQQADSSTSRKFGGTGLGLFISKELALLLGGEVSLESELNKGSIFTVFIPAVYQKNQEQTVLENDKKVVAPAVSTQQIDAPTTAPIDLAQDVNDDRSLITPEDKTILIIEDDESFADVLMQVAHQNGFKAIVAYQGETGFQYAKKYKPKAIILDMKLPGIDGWTVLKWLKEDKDLNHIPVHVMSGMNREKLAKEMGAFDFLIKPITSEKLKGAFDAINTQINSIFKKVLIVEDDINLNYSLKELIHNLDRNIICLQAHNFGEAEMILKNEPIDCAIMDIGLPDSKNIEGIARLKKMSVNKNIKIIVNTGKSLSDAEELELENVADKIVIKTTNATSRIKDEIVLFLDKVENTVLPKTEVPQNLLGGEILLNKNILIVDDDIRNIYSLSSALTAKGAVIRTAFNGLEALEALKTDAEVDVILMDIMMPEMDGYEATRKIRENPKWANIPIIALTAKAMKSDRDDILNAGASDYQSKPIDIQQLISLISIWIYQ